ncbi:MAG: endonuclease MutS2 [Lachnospiraceae bacterium]
MNERVLHTLEYDKILASLCEKAGSEAGKRICKDTLPLSDRYEIEQRQEETAAALSRIERKGSLSFSGIPDVGDIINRVALKATLGPGELRKVAALLSVTLRVKQYGDSSELTDVLTERFSLIEPLEYIAREINRCIISEDEIADDASQTLLGIRRQMRQKKARISDKITALAREAAEDEKLQDNLITMRNGRYCIPVKAEYKNKVPGMIHDRSSTGSTFFIEPIEIVELNNEIRELEIKENEEIERILQMLSVSLIPEIENLKYDVKALGELDAVFARGSLAKSMRAQRPKFTESHSIVLKKARHPLIHPKQVVPIDLELGKNFNLLVITGPNTGGKTVSLKTIGLFQLMGQSGLHIPALGGSELGIFTEVYADIGDEQSIEQSLSTFSSHMTHTVEILDKADENSLVLFDELGAGTDPVEGAALAMAILNDLNNRNVRTMATTHYSELKAYALTTPGVTNGSCEFDVETLKPTYRLLIGVPGKSNAFAISLRLGMSEEILDHAKSLVGEKDRSFDDMLRELEELRHDAEVAEKEAAAKRDEAEKIRAELAGEKEKLDKRRDKEIERAREEAEEILRNAKEYADETIRKINKLSRNFDMKDLEEERRGLRKKLDEVGPQKSEKQIRKSTHKAGDFKIGDTVHVISMDLKGTIHTLPNKKGQCTVTMGIMQYQCNISDLEIVEDEVKLPEKVQRTGAGQIRMSKSFVVSPEINLVGKYPDEAVAELEKYLDDAYLAQLDKVRIIHGRGTGALRKAVHDYLKNCRNVKSFRVGEFGEGDHGVTIVEFK